MDYLGCKSSSATACANVAPQLKKAVQLERKVRGSTAQDEAGDVGREHATDGFVGRVKIVFFFLSSIREGYKQGLVIIFVFCKDNLGL